jgi:hypothetical protein
VCSFYSICLNPSFSWKKHIQREDTVHKQIILNFKVETSEVLNLECGAETWRLWKIGVDQKYRENFEIWYWSRLEKIARQIV